MSTKKTPDGVNEILTGLPESVHCISPLLQEHPDRVNGPLGSSVPSNLYEVTVIPYVLPETDIAAVPKALSPLVQPVPPLPNGLGSLDAEHQLALGMVIQFTLTPVEGQLPCATAKIGGLIDCCVPLPLV
jgi:hypothetical protein